jgi:hypothetical protein
MYPTPSDQLREIRRVLGDVVLPEVAGAYARETLEAALATLGMLEGAWDRVLPFLRWDNDRVAELLVELGPAVDADLAGRISAAASAARPDPADFDASHRRNLDLRGLLATAVPTLAASAGGGLPEPLVAYIRERIARYPFSATAVLPTRK